MIVADTGAVVALVDADDRHHGEMLELYNESSNAWVVPWAVLPAADFLILSQVGAEAEVDFVRDVADARYTVEWGEVADLTRAREICERYRDLRLGLVDAVVMAIAERLQARAIVTLDFRHFGAVNIHGQPLLLPRDR